MSDEPTKQANTLPDPDAAYGHLFDQVHSRVFFQKLAQHGYVPQTQKEAQDLLELGGKLMAVQQDPQTQKAAEAASPLSQASQALDRTLAQNGMDGPLKQASAQEQDVAVRQAASYFAQDPNIYNAVLSMKAAEAKGHRVELGLDQAPATTTTTAE